MFNLNYQKDVKVSSNAEKEVEKNTKLNNKIVLKTTKQKRFNIFSNLRSLFVSKK